MSSGQPYTSRVHHMPAASVPLLALAGLFAIASGCGGDDGATAGAGGAAGMTAAGGTAGTAAGGTAGTAMGGSAGTAMGGTAGTAMGGAGGDMAGAGGTAMGGAAGASMTRGSGTIKGTLAFNGVSEDFDCTIAGKLGSAINVVSASMAAITCSVPGGPGKITGVTVSVPTMVGAHPQELAKSNNTLRVGKDTATYLGGALGVDPMHIAFTNTVTVWDEATQHIAGTSEGTLPHPSMAGMSVTVNVAWDAMLVKQ